MRKHRSVVLQTLLSLAATACLWACDSDRTTVTDEAGGAAGAGGTNAAGVSGSSGTGGSGGSSSGAAGEAGSGGSSGGAAGEAGSGGSSGGSVVCAEAEGSVGALKLTPVIDGLSSLVHFRNAPGDSSRQFIVEQAGKILVLRDGTMLTEPFLDLSSVVGVGSEQGLLGLALHPDYAANGRFFVSYTDKNGDSVIAEYARGADADHAGAKTAVVLTQKQPETNHNGGNIEFGPDGYLYIGFGDGGGAGDVHGTTGNGQSLGTWLGKILRIDVAKLPYSIPQGNMTGEGVLPEIWDYGLRNPWRFAFDECTRALFISDVGQGQHEEVDYEPAGKGGRNYGWRLKEGKACFNPATDCEQGASLVDPIFTYDHDQGCSITGGFVYRGSALPALRGKYLAADYCSGRIWAIEVSSDGTSANTVELTEKLGSAGMPITAFGIDAQHELYVLTHAGAIYRIEPG